MSARTLINPPGTEAIYKSYKFSQAVVANGRVDVAGQVGLDENFEIPDDVEAQARNAFTNVKRVLEAAGSSLEHVTHITMYYTDIGDARAIDHVFSEFFPDNYPARTAVQIGALVLPNLKLEVQVTAVLAA